MCIRDSSSYLFDRNAIAAGKFSPVHIPFLADIPVIGPVLFENPPITFLTLILVFVVHYALFYTRWGLRTRAVGEHPLSLIHISEPTRPY